MFNREYTAIAAGSLSFVKLPAWMVDGSVKGVAAKETKEELSITIREGELKYLNDPAETSRA